MEKVQKELAFWQEKLNATVGRVMNDEHITTMQRIIDMFIHEADNVNETLEYQKNQYKELKGHNEHLKIER